MRDDGELFGLCLGQGRIGRDNGDGRILARPAFGTRRERRRRHARRKAEPAELAISLERRCPEMRPGADIDAAAGVDDDQRADRVSVTGDRGGRAEPALQVDGRGAEAATGGAECECLPRLRGGAVAEIAIERKAAPVLVAAVEQVEHRRAAHERHANAADLEAAPAFAQERLHARAGFQAKDRAAGEHHRIDPLDRAMRLEQVGVACGGRAAAHVDRGNRGLREDDGADAGGKTSVVGVPDENPRDVRDEVLLRHAASLPRVTVAAVAAPGQITASSHPGESAIGDLRGEANAPHLAAWPPTSPSLPRCLPVS